MRVTAKAPANIAFIKYWGKKDKELRLPANSSISMNLSSVYSETSVEFSDRLKKDLVKIDGKEVVGKERERVIAHLDRVRKIAEIKLFAKVESKNNFPRGTGIASSASGFAALTLAATKAAGLDLCERELSILARLGSGSACRSIPDGFVEWKAGKSSNSSYAYSLFPADHWDIRDVVVIVEDQPKKFSSTSGHALARTSPFFKTRISRLPEKIKQVRLALKVKDFTRFGEAVEEEAINMHAVMMTSKPSLLYLSPGTLRIIDLLNKLREKGIESYYTLDAGPNVHVICQAKDLKKLTRILKEVKEVKLVIDNRPSVGAEVLAR